VNDKVGRKHSITIGSVIILIGVILQTASVNSEYLANGHGHQSSYLGEMETSTNAGSNSCNVSYLPTAPRNGHTLLYLRRLAAHCRVGVPARSGRPKRVS